MSKRQMPDVSKIDERQQYAPLDWVGMNAIHLPARLADHGQGEQPVQASAQAYVNLENTASRGIHMSRLYLHLSQTFEKQAISVSSLKQALTAFISSHDGLSSNAHLQLTFDYLIKRQALKSDNAGWKSYPTILTASQHGDETRFELTVNVPYSSTCPASAALARQLIQDAFLTRFGDDTQVNTQDVAAFLSTTDGILATPHSQRSIAQVKVLLNGEEDALPVTALIDQIEAALQTAVQTAVKREDEQEFARLNGQNLLFCEDAARRVRAALEPVAAYQDYWVRVNHLESLHAHDAVAVVTKGVAEGYTPEPGAGITP